MTKPLPIISHMPRHVKQCIVNSTDYASKFALRQCSKEFRGLVCNSKIEYECLKFDLDSDEECVSVQLQVHDTRPVEWKTVQFFNDPNGALMVIGSSVFLLANKNFIDEGVEQFVKLLANSNAVFNMLDICLSLTYIEQQERQDIHETRLLEKLEHILSSFKHQISTKAFFMVIERSSNDILKILRHLKPGFLEDIASLPSMSFLRRGNKLDLSEIAETEQWKQAKNVNLTMHKIDLPREKTAHLSKLTCGYLKDLDEIKYIIENILRDNGWTYRSDSSGWFNYEEVIQYLSQFEELPPETDRERVFIVLQGNNGCQVNVREGSIQFSKVTMNDY